MINVRAFRAEDFMALTGDTGEDAALSAYLREKCGWAYTAEDGDKIIACAGVVVTNGQASVWTCLTEQIKTRAFFLHRTVKRYLSAVIKSAEFYRMEAYVNPVDTKHRRWIEALGFTFECVRRRAGEKGADVAVYVILK